MKGDLPAAAVRLCAALPVRTHSRELPREDGRMRHCANNVSAVIVDGVLYDSLAEAARQCGIGREAIRKRIYKGTARYA